MKISKPKLTKSLREMIFISCFSIITLLNCPQAAGFHFLSQYASQTRYSPSLPRNIELHSAPHEQSQSVSHSITSQKHEHTLAILTMPHSASARIANEAILEKSISVTTRKLSVVLRANTSVGGMHGEVSLTRLRRYAGEVYSVAWDIALGRDTSYSNELLDLIIYPQNLPNTPPEGWIALRPDLSCICSHDSITGWVTGELAGGSGMRYAEKRGQGIGGLYSHVEAVNAERGQKGLNSLVGLHVDDWPDGADVVGDPHVIFLEDEYEYNQDEVRGDDADGKGGRISSLMGGSPILPSSLYSSVAVGGTFDGLHYGHRKLLTLAISSVEPLNGRLMIGVTKDEMLKHKEFSDRIPTMEQRIKGVLDFVGCLAPGMKNRIKCIPISDEFGPPGAPEDSTSYSGVKNDFDALVLSHETLQTGRKLNEFRVNELGLKPLKLLCTQRTEPYGMSSTAMRRMRVEGTEYA